MRKKSGKRGSNPRPSAWEADALPLSYSRKSLVGKYIKSDLIKSIFFAFSCGIHIFMQNKIKISL